MGQCVVEAALVWWAGIVVDNEDLHLLNPPFEFPPSTVEYAEERWAKIRGGKSEVARVEMSVLLVQNDVGQHDQDLLLHP